jgi:hypothetical protein
LIVFSFLYLFTMKPVLASLFLLMVIVSCDKPVVAVQKTLFAQNFIVDHPNWRILNDTMRKSVIVGYKGMEVPMDIEWQRAEDENGCLKIASIRFTQTGGDTTIQMRNFVFRHNPCIYKKGYQQIKKYESMEIDFEYYAKTSFGVYQLKTNLGVIFGDGGALFNRVFFFNQKGPD